MPGSDTEGGGKQERAAPEPLPEGVEAPPPGVRTMAGVRWALVVFMAVAAAGSWFAWARAARGGAEAPASQYHCPMHPTVLQSSAGECPICGMDLVQVSARHAEHGAANASPATPDTGATGKYWCPMHPEVSSDDPEARCSKCGGMKLLPREPAEKKTATVQLRGLAPVEIGAERAQLIGVRTAPVQWRAVAARLRAPASVAVPEGNVAIVTARVSGWVETLRVRETGQRVERGEVLGTLYSQDLFVAQQMFLSTRGLADAQSGSVPFFRVDPAKRLDLLGVAQQDIDAVARRGTPQQTLPFRAPLAGFVASKIDAPGAYVQPGTELFRIADLSTVWIVAEVTERDARRVKVGQRLTFFPDVGSGETYTGTVDLVYPAIDGESGMLMVRASLVNEELALRPGMSGTVAIDAAAEEGFAIPRDALVETGELQYVFVALDGGRFEPRQVRVGLRDHGHVLVLEGVAKGERVVTAANFLIDAESRLRAAVQGFTP